MQGCTSVTNDLCDTEQLFILESFAYDLKVDWEIDPFFWFVCTNEPKSKTEIVLVSVLCPLA